MATKQDNINMKPKQWRQADVSEILSNKLSTKKDNIKLFDAVKNIIKQTIHAIKGTAQDEKNAFIVDLLMLRFKNALYNIQTASNTYFIDDFKNNIQNALDITNANETNIDVISILQSIIVKQIEKNKNNQTDDIGDTAKNETNIQVKEQQNSKTDKSDISTNIININATINALNLKMFGANVFLNKLNSSLLNSDQNKNKENSNSIYTSKNFIKKFGVNIGYLIKIDEYLNNINKNVYKIRNNTDKRLKTYFHTVLKKILKGTKIYVKAQKKKKKSFIKKLLNNDFVKKQIMKITKKGLNKIWKKISKRFQPLINVVKKAYGYIVKILKTLKSAAKIVFRYVKKGIMKVIKTIVQTLKMTVKILAKLFKTVFSGLKTIFSQAIALAKVGIRMLLDLLKNVGKSVVSAIKNGFKKLKNKFFKPKPKKIKKPGFLKKTINKIKNLFSKTKGKIGKLFKNVKNFFGKTGKIFDKIKGKIDKLVKNVINKIGNAIRKTTNKITSKLFDKLGGKFLKKIASKFVKKIGKTAIVKFLKKIGLFLVKTVGKKLLLAVGASTVPGIGWVIAAINIIMLINDFFDLYKMIKELLVENPTMFSDIKESIMKWIKEKLGPVIDGMLKIGKKLFNAIFIEGPKKALLAAGKLFGAVARATLHPKDYGKMKLEQLKAAAKRISKRDKTLVEWYKKSKKERTEFLEQNFQRIKSEILALLKSVDIKNKNIIDEMSKPSLFGFGKYNSEYAWKNFWESIADTDKFTLLGASIGLRVISMEMFNNIEAKLKEIQKKKEEQLKLNKLYDQYLKIYNQEINIEELKKYMLKYKGHILTFNQEIKQIFEEVKEKYMLYDNKIKTYVVL